MLPLDRSLQLKNYRGRFYHYIQTFAPCSNHTVLTTDLLATLALDKNRAHRRNQIISSLNKVELPTLEFQ
jgi:hypothetical protein